MAEKPPQPNFEKTLAELEALVERMEDGELSLEESLQTYEQGVKLSRLCKQALERAEQRIRVLSEREGGTELEPFEPPDDDA